MTLVDADDKSVGGEHTAGMFRGDVAKALRDKFDGDFEADQQEIKAQRLVSEEKAKLAAPQTKSEEILIANQ